MEILMPQLGETVSEGLVATWHKKEGDSVVVNEILLDIETDKVSTEITAPVDGVLIKVIVGEGQTVEVGALLAIVQPEGEELQEETREESENEANKASVQSGEKSTQQVGAEVSIANNRQGEPLRLSPSVRRRLKEVGIDASEITGTGRSGRITLQDVEAHANIVPLVQGGATSGIDDQIGPFSKLRGLIAEHMVRSKATSPHSLQAVEADFSRIIEARNSIKDTWKAQNGYSLTYLPFVASAVCQAITEFPRVNASVEGDSLRIYGAVNLAIAVDMGGEGLVAPVVKNAHKLTIAEIAQAVHELASRARSGQLQPDDLAEGTYTISNCGSYGTLITAPIINQPQVAILSTDGVRKRPVVIESANGDMIAIRPMGVLAMSFDHRAIDGAYSAAFLKKLTQIIENNDWSRKIKL